MKPRATFHANRPYAEFIFGLMEDEMNSAPRTLQRAIGPSGIGHPCHRCLASALAGLKKAEDGRYADGWPAYVGTAIHDKQEHTFRRVNRRLMVHRFLLEQRVEVGMVGDHLMTGSCDAFDGPLGKVVDWKAVSDKNLTNLPKYGVSETYEVQTHCYGLGMENAGHTVKTVGLFFLAKSKNFLRESVYVEAPYDRGIAERALKRANDLQALLDRDGAAYVLPRLKTGTHMGGTCYDCPKYDAAIQALVDAESVPMVLAL